MIVCYRSLPTHKDYNCPDCFSVYYAVNSTCIDDQCIPFHWVHGTVVVRVYYCVSCWNQLESVISIH